MFHVDIPCNAPMGLQNGELPDQQITASSYYNYDLRPQNARLYGPYSWTSNIANENQFLEVDWPFCFLTC